MLARARRPLSELVVLKHTVSQTGRREPRNNQTRVRLVIVDDHALAREGMRLLLGDSRHLEIVGEAANGRDAVALCRHVRPDLVLMDVRLPDMDGLVATRAIRRALPQTKVLLVTMYEAPEYASEALRAGAAGYLLKGASRREVLAALRHALVANSRADGAPARRRETATPDEPPG
jgi:DNA-binding NarL/FixJ family response regulator